jgi:hypothetical protein
MLPVKFCLVLGYALLLASCNRASESPVTTAAPSPSPTASAIPVSPSPTTSSPTPIAAAEPENRLISAEGIGVARLGMTLGELKQQLGPSAELVVQSPFIVDFDAIAVRQEGEVQFYILYLANQPLTDQDVIQGLLTENSAYQTAEKVGPGTSVADAEAAYGAVTLSYNTENESREYARFANQPAGNLSFGTGNGNAEAAGIYSSPTQSYNETKQFKPDATIRSILVVCLREGCTPAGN